MDLQHHDSWFPTGISSRSPLSACSHTMLWWVIVQFTHMTRIQQILQHSPPVAKSPCQVFGNQHPSWCTQQFGSIQRSSCPLCTVPCWISNGNKEKPNSKSCLNWSCLNWKVIYPNKAPTNGDHVIWWNDEIVFGEDMWWYVMNQYLISVMNLNPYCTPIVLHLDLSRF